MKTDTLKNSWLFYRVKTPAGGTCHVLPTGFTYETWRPGVFRLKAHGLPAFPFAVWWIFHMLHVFANRDFGLFIIRYGDEVIHRSVITPKYFRFPFMAADDIQIGDTWTDPRERGKGLATFAIEKILSAKSARQCTCWYIVKPENSASIRVVEKTGFTLVGNGIRTRRLGLGILGRFVMTEQADREQSELTATGGV